MAVTNTSEMLNRGVKVVTIVDDAGGGTAVAVDTAGWEYVTLQRSSGTGTYTVTGSADGTTYGALSTAISAANDTALRTLVDRPAFIKVAVAAAAATIKIVMTNKA
jgi:hypothetical protein